MNVLPIIERELRTRARKPATYWGRIWSPLALMAVLGFALMEDRATGRNATLLGQMLFMALAWFSFLFTLLSGAMLSDSISEEKREGTLGLLFLTNLKGYDIVLGKLSHGGIQSLYALFSVVPVLAVPVLLGGVTMVEVGRLVMALVNTAWLSLCVTLLVSSIFRQQRNSAGATVLALMGFTAFLPVLGGVLMAYLKEYRGLAVPEEFLIPFMLPSPACATFLSFEMTRSLPLGPLVGVGFWVSILVVHALGWLCLIVAAAIVRSVWQDKPRTIQRERLWQRLKHWLQGAAEVRLAHRRRLLNENAIHWLTCRTRLKPYYVTAILALVMAGWIWGALEWRRDWFTAPICIAFAIVTNVLLKLGLAGESGRQIGEDARSGALELMLSTELTVLDILRGQFMTLKRMFFWPAIVGFAFQLFLLAATLKWSVDYLDVVERIELILAFVASLIVLVPDMVAVSWVALWMSLASKKPGQAGPVAGYLVLGVPWGILYGSLAALAFIFNRLGITFHPPGSMLIMAWVALSLVTDGLLFHWARKNLIIQFRTVAARRYLAEEQVALPVRVWRWLRGKRDESPKLSLSEG